ncbi:MAG: nickel pincer cofactor biosynthesis protein LarC [Phycisphaeraceae bacterium]|nr:nickel pincer cofactor biosynthesis protein LarC [Phycisphaeraceae bacterium]
MIGYFDLPSGLSGDMFLGCLIDAGWPIEELRSVISQLGLPPAEWSIQARSVMKGPLRATLVLVHAHEGHHHRHLKHIKQIIESSRLADAIKARAVRVFTRLAEAEAKVHGSTVDKIHFHEVGAVDAIIDIVGCVAGLAALGVTDLYSSPPALGSGFAQTAHGQIPLPAPATLELLAAAQAPTRDNPRPGVVGELLTPTGAALLAELATFRQPALRMQRIATGAGQRDSDWPNVARLILGQPAEETNVDQSGIIQIDTNIDDMNPQFFAAVCDKLLDAGAKDVWLTPVQMKKNRPAVVLSTLASADLEDTLCKLILRHTSTLGLRIYPVRRHEAQRTFAKVQTPFGEISVKLKWLDGKPVSAAPEYADCLARAAANDVPLQKVFDAAITAAQPLLA